MFIVSGPQKVFAAPEERHVADGESSLPTFRSSGALVLGLPCQSINIPLLRS